MKSIPCHLPPNAPGHLRTRCSGRFWAYSGICAVILIAAAVALQPVHALQIAVVKQENLVYLQRVAPGDRFSTGYIHSVERSPVWEYFCIDPDYRIILRETTFKSSNVGLPYAAFGDEVFHSETDGFRITNMNRMIPRLLIWADRSYKNRLQFRGEDLALYGFEGNTLVQVDVGAWCLGAYALKKAAIWMGTR